MASSIRRGPRYGTARPADSVGYRGSLDQALMDHLGLSAHAVHQLRFVMPGLLARAIAVMRQRGETAAVAAICGPIDAACAGMTLSDEDAATLAEEAAENTLNLAEKRYALDKSDANRREVLRLSAREMLLQAERDKLLREVTTR